MREKDDSTLNFLTDLLVGKEEKQIIADIFEDISDQKILEHLLNIKDIERKKND